MGAKTRNAGMRRAGSFANYGVSAIAIRAMNGWQNSFRRNCSLSITRRPPRGTPRRRENSHRRPATLRCSAATIRRHPEIVTGVRRTLERRIGKWRALYGPSRGWVVSWLQGICGRSAEHPTATIRDGALLLRGRAWARSRWSAAACKPTILPATGFQPVTVGACRCPIHRGRAPTNARGFQATHVGGVPRRLAV